MSWLCAAHDAWGRGTIMAAIPRAILNLPIIKNILLLVVRCFTHGANGHTSSLSPGSEAWPKFAGRFGMFAISMMIRHSPVLTVTEGPQSLGSSCPKIYRQHGRSLTLLGLRLHGPCPLAPTRAVWRPEQSRRAPCAGQRAPRTPFSIRLRTARLTRLV